MYSQQTPTWGKGWIGPYEGAFTLALKSAWANLPTEAGTGALFNGQSFGCGWQSQGGASLLSRPPDSGAMWLDRCLSHYAGDWTFELASDQHFRFCPECLRHGYQASVYQVQALRVCPIHYCELKTTCMRCGASTCSYSLNRLAFTKPFHCWRCGEKWVDGLTSRSLADTEALHAACETRLAKLYRWLSSLQRFAIVDRRKILRLGHSCDGWYRIIDPDCRLLERMGVDRRIAGFWIATQLSSMSEDSNLFVKLDQRVAFASVVVKGNTDLVSHGDHGPLAAFIPIYKSIRRYIVRHYLRRCRRKMVIDLAAFPQRHVPHKTRRLLASCFAIWRRRFELAPDLDLYERVQRSWNGYLRMDGSLPDAARRCRFFYADALLKWYSTHRDSRWPFDLLPSFVLSNFFSLCNEVVATLDEVTEDQGAKERYGAPDAFSVPEVLWQNANLRQRLLDSTEFTEQASGPYFGIGDAFLRTHRSQIVMLLVHSSFAAMTLARS